MEILIIILGFIGLLFLWYIVSLIDDRFPSKKTKTNWEIAKQKTIELQEQQKQNDYEAKKEELIKEHEKIIIDYDKKKDELEKQSALLHADLTSKIEYQKKIIKDFDKIIIEKCNYYPQLAVIMSDLLTVYYERSAKFLENKPHPANTEAMRIRDLRIESKKIIAEKKNLEYKLTYIQNLFPNIMDVLDPGFEEDNFILETDETTDKVRNFLTSEEYKQLSENERNQLALDRYLNNRTKTKWQVGRDYEMYIGYLCEEHGYQVLYTGIINKLEDMGRDLIVIDKSKTYIIQCKYWSHFKEIHEKHIFQLFGTVTLYRLQNPSKEVFGVFITPNNLSKTAEKVANELNITIIKKEIDSFPRIKCNINRITKEKIYHLPFDQQYDSVIIEKNKGEFYAHTVAEAFEKGFRRAFKHFVN